MKGSVAPSLTKKKKGPSTAKKAHSLTSSKVNKWKKYDLAVYRCKVMANL